jgi:hypothetical protein
MREGWWRARTHYASKPSATIGLEVKRAVLASLARSTAARARFIRAPIQQRGIEARLSIAA